ncbi:MAG: tetratricopeptide repeat protein, partial [Acidithiobacillus sp.]
QYNLGNLYFMGQGVSRDYQKAAYWWQKAAASGNADASRNLAVLAKMEPAVLHSTPLAGPVATSAAAPQG